MLKNKLLEPFGDNLEENLLKDNMNLFDENFFFKYVFIFGCARFLLRMGFSLQWLVMGLGL